ncbi:MAG: YdgA family protein [Pseudomonas sp.]
MSKSAKVAVGIVVAVAVLSTAGAWYTGGQLEGVLRTTIDEANHQVQTSLNGFDGSATLELVSIERHVFSSTAHYRMTLKSPKLGNDNIELLFVDNIEHGPLPFSRLKTLNLVPVMAASNYEIEKNASTEKWFALTNGATPLKGHTAIGYDRSVSGTLDVLPLDIKNQDSAFKFSGLNLMVDSSDNGDKVKVVGTLAGLNLTMPSEQGPVTVELHNATFNTGGTKGASGFYLGHSDFKIANSMFQVAGKPPLILQDFVNTSLLQEDGGNLAAQATYDIGMINYSGQDVGAAQMLWKVGNFDVASTQALYTLYQQKIQPQQQAAALAGQPLQLHLNDADQAQLDANLLKLLAAKPHIELEKLSLKTPHGESQLHIALDLNSPGTLDQQVPDLVKKLLSQLEAKLVISKPMIKDVASMAATINGITDPKAIEKQAQDASDTVGGMAVMTQLAKVQGDDVVSTLHYANDVVDFNDQKMTVPQFVNFISSKLGPVVQ